MDGSFDGGGFFAVEGGAFDLILFSVVDDGASFELVIVSNQGDTALAEATDSISTIA